MRGDEAATQVIELFDRGELGGVRVEAALGEAARVEVAEARRCG